MPPVPRVPTSMILKVGLIHVTLTTAHDFNSTMSQLHDGLGNQFQRPTLKT